MVHRHIRVVAALVALVGMLSQGTWVLAGTTGSLSGTVTDPSTNQPVTGAHVSAASPSQSVSTTTDTTGHYAFLSLAPDTYTISVDASSGRDAVSVSGVTVQADQALSVNLSQPQRLKQIGSVTSRAASALVKPGTVADVYSINATTQDKAAAVGGGGNLNSAWSAISSVPGVFVVPNQTGYIGGGSSLSIRGGDYDQIGYELDGVPVNRSFDQYPSGPLSSLGQQELQVYTGAPSATSEANGISGYINQVIRTGTAPASRNLTIATGSPSFYGKLAFEAGGANPSRTFSYYLGVGAYNQNFRFYDQYNGASLQHDFGAPLAVCPAGITQSQAPSCFDPAGNPYTNNAATPAYALGPPQTDLSSGVQDRDSVVNLHFGIPQKNGNRDDVQLLFDNNFINTSFYSSTNDLGGAAFLNAIGVGVPTYTDGFNFTGAPLGGLLPANYAGGGIQPYLFPDSPQGRALGAPIAPDRRDAFVNNQSILKLQYQHNFGTNAFLRVYGYSYYSDWLQNGPQSTLQTYLGAIPSQYLLDSHTRGVSTMFADQLNPQHLLTIQGSYTTASTLRDNNTFFAASPTIGYLVNGSDPTSGVCYGGAPGAVVAVPGCGAGTQTFNTAQAFGGGVTPASAFGTCGTGPCQYIVVSNGVHASYNTVTPRFLSGAISDQWTPTSRLNVALGLHFDQFQFVGSNTINPARTLFYNAYNLNNPGANLQNISGVVQTYDEWQPRAGFTYTLNPGTVLRFSYGRYAEAPNAAFEQYNFLQANDIGSLLNFQTVGLPATPSHMIRPEVSNNYDFSYEHQFPGQMAVKITPFLRKTQDQIQNFYLDARTGFTSGLNVGRQTSQGVEFELDKGDFSRNGLAARLSFAYTNSYITYGALPNGGSVIDSFNSTIAAYNAFTKAGGGAPCYRPGSAAAPGAADPGCAAGSIANPYYNAPLQPLMDVHGNYATYSLFPSGAIGSAPPLQYGAPYVSTLIVQYKHGPLAITPAVQFLGGIRYGAPATTPGVLPNQCGAPGFVGNPSSDPRYPYGAAGGSAYDATACGSGLVIPNPFTGRFDNLGAFVEPNQALLHTQITYDVNKRLTLVGNFANIINRCFGGTKVAWAVNHVCSYETINGGNAGILPVGNIYNPGDNIQPFLRVPYGPNTLYTSPGFTLLPFNMYFEARLKV